MSHMKKIAALSITAALGLSCVFSGAVPGTVTAIAATVSSDSQSQTYSSTADGENAVLVNGSTVTLTDPTITKTGDSSSEEADFTGTNAAVLAENGATLTITGGSVTTDGSHANGIFSYGSGTTVNVSGTSITTSSNNSGALMTTGGGTMNATDVTAETSGNSSAAIRSDRGGGDVNISGGTYSTSGVGSPAIYSTADIDVDGAVLSTTQSEGVVIEGANSVTLNNTALTANNVTKNGQAQTYQAVMIYQSMSGDAAQGTASFTAYGGSIINQNGYLFYVTNTSAVISLSGVSLSNASDDLLVIQAGPWGSSGSNGGSVDFSASSQELEGSITVDSISSLNLTLTNSSFTGSINSSGSAGSVYVSVPDGSTWTLTADSYITSLTCGTSSIDLNGYTLYVNRTAYTEGTVSSGSEVSGSESSDSGSGSNSGSSEPGQAPADQNGQMPSDRNGEMPSDMNGQVPPELPSDGNFDAESDSGTVPADRPELPPMPPMSADGTMEIPGEVPADVPVLPDETADKPADVPQDPEESMTKSEEQMEETEEPMEGSPNIEMISDLASMLEQQDSTGTMTQIINRLKSAVENNESVCLEDVLRIAAALKDKSVEEALQMSVSDLITEAQACGLLDPNTSYDGSETIDLMQAVQILRKAMSSDFQEQIPAEPGQDCPVMEQPA